MFKILLNKICKKSFSSIVRKSMNIIAVENVGQNIRKNRKTHEIINVMTQY